MFARLLQIYTLPHFYKRYSRTVVLYYELNFHEFRQKRE